MKENILNEFLKFSLAGGCELAVGWKERGEAHRASESDGKTEKKINDQNDPLRIFPIAVGGWGKKILLDFRIRLWPFRDHPCMCFS